MINLGRYTHRFKNLLRTRAGNSFSEVRVRVRVGVRLRVRARVREVKLHGAAVASVGPG